MDVLQLLLTKPSLQNDYGETSLKQCQNACRQIHSDDCKTKWKNFRP